MTDYELLRIIGLLERMRRPFDQVLQPAEPDANWNITLYLMKCHLRGQAVTKSSLASAAEVPFASAMRRIRRLIETGDIEQQTRTASGKSFHLVPSARMRSNFVAYAVRIKVLLAETFGAQSGKTDEADYYFGGAHPAGRVIPPLEIMESRNQAGQDLRFLLHDDNYFASMRDMWSDFRSKLSSPKNFSLLGLAELRDEVLANGRRETSRYDVIAVNLPWLGEVVTAGLARPLTDFLANSGIDEMDFHRDIWATGTWNKVQYGVPIYCTVEALVARKDLFAEHGLGYPTSFDKVVEAGKALHQPRRGVYGMVWNAARGMPIAHSFLFFLACCGGAVVNLPGAKAQLDYSTLSGEQLRPTVLGEPGRRTLDYMRRLLSISPPDILTIDWNRALEHFLTGHAGMAYCWTMRAARFEYDIRSAVRRKVEYLPQPQGPGGSSVSPIGGFLLMVPASLPPERARLAFEAIAWMVSPAAMKEHVRNGFPVAPRFSVSADPEAAVGTPIVRFVDRLAKTNKLQTWQRPPVPEFHRIEAVLGEEIYAALSGEATDQQALERSQNRIDAIMRGAGYY